MAILTSSLWRRRLAGALLTWLVPFLAAVPFYGKNGALLIDLPLFKSLMIVISALTAAILFVWFFRAVGTGYTREALITGFLWLGANWTLDLVVLVGLLGMPPADYTAQIGVRYLMIPVLVTATGIVADDAIKQQPGA
jgi:hypothetical protein